MSLLLQSFRSVSSDLHQCIIISTDEDPSLLIKSSVVINIHGVSTKLYFDIVMLHLIQHSQFI